VEETSLRAGRALNEARNRMSKPIENWVDTYEPAVFAEKHGLTIQQAKTSSAQMDHRNILATWERAHS
jgi:hypothetical protein